MNNLYIRIVDGQPDYRPYTLEQVKGAIYQNANVILPANLTDTILSQFGYYPVQINIIDNVEDKLKKYTTSEVKRIYKNNEDIWTVDIEHVVNTHLLLSDWQTVKKERNKLLLDTDWIQVSELVTEDTKKRYKAYRELIRDIVRVAKYPCDITYTKPPMIEYIDEVEQKNHVEDRPKLTSVEFEKLKDYNTVDQDWYKFLVEWSKLNFETDRAIVSNLITAYTNTTLENILDYD